MPVPKLKNLAILILVFANLALALLVFPGRIAADQEQAELRQTLCSLYAKQEITLTPEAIPDTVTLYMLELQENSDSDLQAAAALLGEQLLVQDDSTRYLSAYRSEQGQCSISRSGEFSAQLTGQEEVRNPVTASRKLLKNMGFSHQTLPEAVRVRAGVYSVHATQTVLGVPVFSDGLTLTWSNSRLSTLEGTFFTGAETLTRVSDKACISAADALVAFLDARYGLGWVGSAVTGLQQGYIRSETAAAAAVRLTPVWRLQTDTGTFQINGMTGEITPV